MNTLQICENNQDLYYKDDIKRKGDQKITDQCR